MSNRNYYIAAIIGVVILVLGVRTCSNSNFLKRYNWSETYQDKKNHVYGTYIIKRFIEYTSQKGIKNIDVKLSKYFEGQTEIGNYIFVGEAMLFDDSDAKALADFVAKGNNAIISSKVFPNTLSKLIYETCLEYEEAEEGVFEDLYNEEDYVDETDYKEEEYDAWKYSDIDNIDFLADRDTSMVLSLDSGHSTGEQSLDLYKTYKNSKAQERNWYYMHDSVACLINNDITVLGHLGGDKINFFELPHEDGSFFIHTNPFVFTNEPMLSDQNAEYIAGVLSNCSQENWYWDEYSKTDVNRGRARNGKQNHISSKGPLSYILDQPPLAWAWYCLLVMGLLFLLFKAKRKQRVIPVLVENQNTSLAFINTIGNLYFRKNDHGQLCDDQFQLWLEKIRTQYRINTSKQDDEFVTKLSLKSKVPIEDLRSIIDFYQNIQSSNFVSENTMIQFYQKINQFEIQSK